MGRRPARSRAGASPEQPSIGRRHFLGLGIGVLALSACQAVPQQPSSTPTTTTLPPEPVPATIDDLLSTRPFYVAHRGSGDNWVEHTMEAYSRSVGIGAKAIEVSVHATSDGVLVCHHDGSTERMTGLDGSIAEMTYDELRAVRNDGRAWLGPAAALQPIPLLEDVLDRFAASQVIFLEDKQGTNTQPLLEVMATYPQATEHIVWKQWAGAKQHRVVREAGYRTWGYFTEQILDRLDELAPEFDLLGVSHLATDEEVARVVAVGKPVIAWEVHYRSMRDRMLGLGVHGMMCSNLPYVTGSKSVATTDAFASGLRAAGDLPWSIDEGARLQPVIDASAASVTLRDAEIQSYLMGSMCPIDPSRRSVTFEMRWPEKVPEPGLHAGIAFGMEDDTPYRVRVESTVGGYHLVMRSNGSLELFKRSAGTQDGTSLAVVKTAVPIPGEWMQLQIEVTDRAIGIYRLDSAGWGREVDDATYRGGYLWLCKNYVDGPRVEFRAVVVN